MRYLLLMTMIVFPMTEIWILLSLTNAYGWWVLLYLVVVALLGLQLIRDEKNLLTGRMMQSLTQGGNPIKAMFGSARNIFAGVLLIIPGVMTDVMAAILLLIPMNTEQQPQGSQFERAANDDVIEGEYHRED